MLAARAFLTAVVLVAMASVARAQPVDPYKQPSPPPAAPPDAQNPPATPPPAPAAPTPAPAPAPGTQAPAGEAPVDPYAAPAAPAPVAPTSDRSMAERVAKALVTRAQELLDARAYLDAKQLAVEALVASPRGPSAEQARSIVHTVNRQLGIPEDMPKELVKPDEDVDTTPIGDPTLPAAEPVAAPPEGRIPTGKLAARVHGALLGGLVGASIGAFFSSDTPAAGAVPVGIAVAAGGAFATPRLVDRLGWTDAQIRMAGSATIWGGMIGGLFGDIAKTEGTSVREVLVPASITAMLVGAGSYAFVRQSKLTRGDVALIDTFAGIGAVGGFTVGMVMQPVETEAYSLNSVLGIAGGLAFGVVLAPRTNTTPRRMLRIAGFAAAGGAAPFALYAAIASSRSSADERVTGILSSAGLVGGALLGFRWTRKMDEGRDTLDGKPRKEADDAPVALIGRSSDGRWGLGGLGFAPLSKALAPQNGMALQLLGGAF